MFMANVYLNDTMLKADLLCMYAACSLATLDTEFSLQMLKNDFRYGLPAWSVYRLLGCVCFIHLVKQVWKLQRNEYESSKEWTKVIVWLQSERLAGYL